MPSLETRRRRREAANNRAEEAQNNIESGYGLSYNRNNNNNNNYNSNNNDNKDSNNGTESIEFQAGNRINTGSISSNFTFRLAFISTFMLFSLWLLFKQFNKK